MNTKTGKKVSLNLWHIFSNEEFDEKSQSLASETLEYRKVESDKKISSDTFTNRLKSIESMAQMLSQQVKDRGLYRPTDCIIPFHTPAIAIKRTTRTWTLAKW